MLLQADTDWKNVLLVVSIAENNADDDIYDSCMKFLFV